MNPETMTTKICQQWTQKLIQLMANQNNKNPISVTKKVVNNQAIQTENKQTNNNHNKNNKLSKMIKIIRVVIRNKEIKKLFSLPGETI